MTWQSIIISVVSVILTGLASWAVSVLVAWLNTKIKNDKLRAILNQAISSVTSVVQATYQTFVETLKAKGEFTPEAQREALNQARTAARAQLSTEFTNYMTESGTDIEEWLTTQIESSIYQLKNK
ncbi:hypothetical protein [Anaerocaecibacter muris]|uniref:hypothetical protein n=1 Tax=Anaerocaecibacter muris TaxID=2941513 RepID=UPI00203CB45C|nr:hypothetical protein [Anaerocaecibacter muris]MCX4312859.1 hypothetical protein [Clostridia bacterium]